MLLTGRQGESLPTGLRHVDRGLDVFKPMGILLRHEQLPAWIIVCFCVCPHHGLYFQRIFQATDNVQPAAPFGEFGNNTATTDIQSVNIDGTDHRLYGPFGDHSVSNMIDILTFSCQIGSNCYDHLNHKLFDVFRQPYYHRENSVYRSNYYYFVISMSSYLNH